MLRIALMVWGLMGGVSYRTFFQIEFFYGKNERISKISLKCDRNLLRQLLNPKFQYGVKRVTTHVTPERAVLHPPIGAAGIKCDVM